VMIHFPRAAEFHFDFLGWQGRHYRLRDLQMKTEWKCSWKRKKKKTKHIPAVEINTN
jgi:hypothetical protein